MQVSISRLSEVLPKSHKLQVDKLMLGPLREISRPKCASCAMKTSAMQPSSHVATLLHASSALEDVSSARFADCHTTIS